MRLPWLMMGPRQLLWRHALNPLRRVKKRLPKLGSESRRERRYYQRIWDLNNAGWGEVGRSAASIQPVAEPFFNMEVFNQLVRGPDHVHEFRNVHSEASGLKLLLGFLLWGEQHL